MLIDKWLQEINTAKSLILPFKFNTIVKSKIWLFA